MLKHPVQILEARGVRVVVAAKRKDILEDLMRDGGWAYHNVMPRKRRTGAMGMAIDLAVRDWRIFQLARHTRPDVLVGTSAEIAHVGRVLGIPSLVICEDDADVVPLLARAAYPFATAIVSPDVVRAGRWETKKIGYAGYQKLSYLHPRRFTPDRSVAERLSPSGSRYFVIRTVELTAHHDRGIKGLTQELVVEAVRRLEVSGRVYISSEGAVPSALKDHQLVINPAEIHHVLAGCSGYIGDSQSMAVEAAILGVPSIRYSDFSGRISVLEELEHRYLLTEGIPTSDPRRLLHAVDRLASGELPPSLWQERRDRMLSEKVDVASFWSDLFMDFITGRRTHAGN
jgi:predicted glycosyltransferase